jgi:hypothetical protein
VKVTWRNASELSPGQLEELVRAALFGEGQIDEYTAGCAALFELVVRAERLAVLLGQRRSA